MKRFKVVRQFTFYVNARDADEAYNKALDLDLEEGEEGSIGVLEGVEIPEEDLYKHDMEADMKERMESIRSVR